MGIPIAFEGAGFEVGFRADLIVARQVIVELKSVEKVSPAHKKQLLTCLKVTGRKLGYLLNFGKALTRNGITRTINGTFKEPPCLPASVRNPESKWPLEATATSLAVESPSTPLPPL